MDTRLLSNPAQFLSPGRSEERHQAPPPVEAIIVLGLLLAFGAVAVELSNVPALVGELLGRLAWRDALRAAGATVSTAAPWFIVGAFVVPFVQRHGGLNVLSFATLVLLGTFVLLVATANGSGEYSQTAQAVLVQLEKDAPRWVQHELLSMVSEPQVPPAGMEGA